MAVSKDFSSNEFIAHISEDGKRKQSVKEHLQGTARLAGEFATCFNNAEFAYNCGLLHDRGKYSREFQKRINGSSITCDHSSAGGKDAMKYYPFGKIAAQCIAGHHSGLLNTGTKSDCKGDGTFYSRIAEDNVLPDYSAYKEDDVDYSNVKFDVKIILKQEHIGYDISFFTRMIYSCLTDADFLDTEAFMKDSPPRLAKKADFNQLKIKLDEKLATFKGGNLINDSRCKILSDCISAAEEPKGLFSLTVPTGAGKTVSSMAFAVNHAIKHNLRRIIYVIPYTSIIEQNAKVFSDIFGSDCILEHHSNFDFNDKDTAKKYAAENWDMPIVITTNVQFFESFHANKSSRCRKLHNVADSVIIFDEAQMFPIDYLIPCTALISQLTANYNCSVMLCSATQPSLNKWLDGEVKEICGSVSEMQEIFRRTDISAIGSLDDMELANQLQEKNQALCIVNSRRQAVNIFSLLQGDGIFHLSTLMCPRHRRETIKEIKQRLKDGQRCIVVSTQLIECGVDVDFPVVYRSSCGLDSLIQSAGRCNREGKLKNENGEHIRGKVYCFEPEGKYTAHMPKSLKYPMEVTQEVIRNCEKNNKSFTSVEAIKDYFDKLYLYRGEDVLDLKGIYKELNSTANARNIDGKFNYNFKTVADKFKLINENTMSVIIPYNDEAKELIDKLEYTDNLKSILRKLQSYTVNVYEMEYKKLLGAGKLKCFAEDSAILLSEEDYDRCTGLKTNFTDGIAIFC